MAKTADMREVAVSKLKPYERNAKIHGDYQLSKLKDSIREFGFLTPCLIDRDYNLIAGHGRVMAAQQLGMKTVPCVFVEGLTDAQRRAYILADNKLGELGEWDMEIVTEELTALNDDDFDISLTGFDLDLSEPPKAEEDDYSAVLPDDPKSKSGNIYKLGRHRLMCGDSTSIEDISRLTDLWTVNLAVTDPPYGVSIVSGGSAGGSKPATFKGTIGGSVVCEVNQYAPIKGDETTDTAKQNYEITKDISENQIIFGGNYFTDFLPPSPCWIVWDKQNGANNFADVELAWSSFDSHARLYSWMWNGMAREGSRISEGIKRVHPTQKPVGLIAKILGDFSEEGDVILDSFGGSGSTLIACEQMNRTCLMMEYEPSYIDVIIDRWEQFTGGKAVLLNG